MNQHSFTARAVAFGRALRDAGLRVTTAQIALFVEALDTMGAAGAKDTIGAIGPIDATDTIDAIGETHAIDVMDRLAFHDVARATLVSAADEIDIFERTFARFWISGRAGPPVLPAPDIAPMVPPRDAFEADPRPIAPAAPASAQPTLVDRRRTWSASEVLRHARFDRLDADDASRAEALVRAIAWRVAPRRTRRYRRASHGTLMDWRRMVQRAVRDQGEWIERRWRVRRMAPRPLVVLADISGSMEAWSRMLLGFLHGLTQDAAHESHSTGPADIRPKPAGASGHGGGQSRVSGAAGPPAGHRAGHPGEHPGGSRGGHRVETFVFGTRLTRITHALAQRDVDAALTDVSARVVDWAGGTRIGDSLHAFNRHWARRVLGRGAIVLVISDALDRGDPQRLAREVDRLRRSCARLVWLNPLLGTEGYEPRTRGLLAALPFVDDFLPVYNVASLEALARRLERMQAGDHRSSATRFTRRSPARRFTADARTME